jgi:NitT/TauT family transport system substrate-binding protein
MAAAVTITGARPAVAQSKPLRYGMAPAEDAALAAYAAAKGFFTAAGVEIELVPFPSGGAITPALLGGSLDLGVTNTGSLASAHVRGVPLVQLAGGSLYTTVAPSAHVVALKGGSIRTPANLAGKTIAVSSLREFAHCSVLAWLDKSGVDAKSVMFVEMPLPTAVAAMQAGHVDAVDLVEPLYTLSKDAVIDLGTPLGAVAERKPVQIFATIAQKSFVAANPDAVARVASALRASARWANDPRNHAEAATIVAGYTKVDAATVNAYPRLRFAESNDAALVQPSIDMLARYAFIAHGFGAAELFV